MKRRDLITVVAAICSGVEGLAQKPAPNIEPPAQRQVLAVDAKQPDPVKRPWVISNRMVKILAVEPSTTSRYLSLSVLGEDGKRYPIDDVIYGILTVLENHLFPEKK